MTIEQIRERIRAVKPSLVGSLDEAIQDERDALVRQKVFLRDSEALSAASNFYAEEITEWITATVKARVITATDVLYTRRTPTAKAIATALIQAEKEERT
jgi:hypothetical protein